jgi:cytoplasmic iron level regulating protein YaaA (DUF328/UPF0246 family)
MLIVLSPAKSLDFDTKFNCPNSTKPSFQNETSLLIENLKHLTSDDLQKLMAISKKLGDLNYQRFQDFKNNFERQAVKKILILHKNMSLFCRDYMAC